MRFCSRIDVMAGQLIPPPGYEPQVPKGATPQECIRIWAELMDTCHEFLLAGLRRKIGPQGDLKAAYRQWYAEQMEEHDQMIRRMAQWPQQRRGDHGG
jgi:hypothetical protein